MQDMSTFFVTNANSNDFIWPLWCDTDQKEIIYIDTLITLWYEFKNDFDAQGDFGKKFVTKKLLLSYILNLSTL